MMKFIKVLFKIYSYIIMFVVSISSLPLLALSILSQEHEENELEKDKI